MRACAFAARAWRQRQPLRLDDGGVRRTVTDGLAVIAPQVVATGVGLVVAIVLARGLGPVGMGHYALMLSITGLVSLLSDPGVGQAAIRYAVRAAVLGDANRHQAVLQWALRLRLALVLALTAVALLVAPLLLERLWHMAALTPALRLCLVLGVAGAFAPAAGMYYQSLQRFGPGAGVAISQSFLVLGAVLVATGFGHRTASAAAIAVAAATALGALVGLAFLPWGLITGSFRDLGNGGWRRPLTYRPAADEGTGIYGFTRQMGLSSLLVAVTMRLDVWLMGALLPADQLGHYSVATRFTLPLVLVLGAFGTLLWPRAAAVTGAAETRQLMGRTLGIAVAVSLLGALYGLLAPLLAPLLFGPAYADATGLARLLCWRYCVAILVCPIGIIGYNFDLQATYWKINALQLMVVLAINLLLLPVLGPLGAAWALVGNEVTGLMLTGWVIRRRAWANEER